MVDINFARVKWWCEEAWYTPGARWLVNRGIYSSNPQDTRVGMYKLKEAIEKFCNDLLALHQRKCDCPLAGMATWRFSSHRKVMKSLLMSTWYKSLQSVNYHDSCAHSYEGSRVLAGLVDFGMVWIGYVWLVNHSGQLWLRGVTSPPLKRMVSPNHDHYGVPLLK
jgi:hypothetical protein